jgi:hypothetical protein
MTRPQTNQHAVGISFVNATALRDLWVIYTITGPFRRAHMYECTDRGTIANCRIAVVHPPNSPNHLNRDSARHTYGEGWQDYSLVNNVCHQRRLGFSLSRERASFSPKYIHCNPLFCFRRRTDRPTVPNRRTYRERMRFLAIVNLASLLC